METGLDRNLRQQLSYLLKIKSNVCANEIDVLYFT